MLANLLSFSRIPLALLLLGPPPVAVSAIVAACLTDVLDGWWARRSGTQSHFGTVLDPIADKVFVLFGLAVLQLGWFETCAFLSREVALILYFLIRQGRVQIKAFISGKVMTSLQFVVFVLLFGGWEVSPYVYPIFMGLGISSLIELLLRSRVNKASHTVSY